MSLAGGRSICCGGNCGCKESRLHWGAARFSIFAVLVQSTGQLVTKDELIARVWPGVIIEENTLQVHISAVRKVLGADRGMFEDRPLVVAIASWGDWAIRKRSTLADPIALDPTRMPVPPCWSNIPAASSEIIGRSAAVEQLRDILCAYRTITLTGPGGIGKNHAGTGGCPQACCPPITAIVGLWTWPPCRTPVSSRSWSQPS